MSKPKVSPNQCRAATVERLQIDGETQFRASLSSEEPVERIFGTEILEHSSEAIDMSRAAEGLPLTLGHSERDPLSPRLPVGRVSQVYVGDDRRLRGSVEFDTDEEGAYARGKVERGLAGLSVSYRVLDYEGPDKEGEVRVTRWRPDAVSVVSVPADATVGVGRSLETETEVSPVSDERTPEAGVASIVQDAQTRSKASHAAGIKEGMRIAAERLAGINETVASLSRSLPHAALELQALAEDAATKPEMTLDAFRAAAIQIATGGAPLEPANPPPAVESRSMPAPSVPSERRQSLVQPGADQSERIAKGVELALLERIGTAVPEDEMRGNQFRGWPVTDMQRELLEANKIDTRGMSRKQIAQASMIDQGVRAISPGTAAYVTSDFPAVTANVLTKRVNDAFEAADVVWNQWCSTIEVPDFKQFDVPRLSQINSLPTVAENAAYQNLTQVDAREQATLVKRGGLISWSWEAMVNDDAGMLMRTADRLGEAAARTLDETTLGVLTTNGNMGDGNPLFDALHGNTGTDALAKAGIVATRTRMAKQTDDNSQFLGVRLVYILVPEDLRETAVELATADNLPIFVSGTSEQAGAQEPNTLRGTFNVIATARLTDATDWYALGRIGQNVEIAFLAGNRNPAIERESGWDTDAMHYKVRHPSIAYAIDWRGMQRNVVT